MIYNGYSCTLQKSYAGSFLLRGRLLEGLAAVAMDEPLLSLPSIVESKVISRCVPSSQNPTLWAIWLNGEGWWNRLIAACVSGHCLSFQRLKPATESDLE